MKHYEGIFSEFPKQTPSNGVPDGPMFGNGDLGIVAGGKGNELTFWISKNDFWQATYSHNEESVGGVKGLAVLKICSEHLKNAEFLAKQKIITADVEITLKTKEKELLVKAYAPYQQSMIVTEIEAIKGNLPLRVFLSPLADDWAEYSRENRQNITAVTKEYVMNTEWETKAACVGRILEWNSIENVLKEGEKITVVTSVRTNHDAKNYKEASIVDVCELTEEMLKHYRAKHELWWKEFWNTSEILIPSEPEIEKFWYGSHYLMACCAKKGKFAPGIFGNWITTNRPNWAGDYHLNYNYQAPWWGVFSSNKVELSEPYDQPILEYIPQAKMHAKERLGCGGIYSKVGIGPKGFETSRMFYKDGTVATDASFWGQKSNASYAAINMLMRFYSTYDEEYARACAYPYLLEVTDFWEDYLTFEDGRYVIYNDCIHENAAAGKGVFDWSENVPDYSDDFNPILTLGLVRCVFKGILEMSEFLGLDEKRREKWQHILTHISEYPLQERNGKTVFRYTERGMEWCDSNSLGVQHIFPAGMIGLGSEEKLLQIARDTIQVMGRWSDFNAFPTFFTAAARVGYDPDIILSKFKEQFLNHTFPNFFIYYGGGGIECCSAVPSCINEMLFQSHEGILRFFPVWNKQKEAAFTKLRAYGAFLVSAKLQDGKVQNVEIFSEKGRECKVLCPWEQGMKVMENGEETLCENEETRDGIVYRFETEAGKNYKIESK